MNSTFVRLLASLEDFAAQESLQLAAGDIGAVRKIQERAAPVVEELARLGRHAIPPESRERLAVLMDRRLQNQEFLDRQVGGLRDALSRIQANLCCLGQIAPVYGRHADNVRGGMHRGTRALA